MKAREHDPQRLDVERFASDAGSLQGDWPLRALERLVGSTCPDAPPGAQDRVAWQVRGEHRRAAGQGQTWLRLSLDATVNLTCQRCLAPVATPLVVDRWFRFVAGEAEAAVLDEDLEEDVLASTRSLDLLQLAEDELLLALPLVPRHEVCPVPLSAPTLEIAVDEAAAHPFAVLAGLKPDRH